MGVTGRDYGSVGGIANFSDTNAPPAESYYRTVYP